MSRLIRWSVFLALGLSACGADVDSPDVEPDPAPPSGDEDGDGYADFEGDCDDNNPDVFPWHREDDGEIGGCGWRVSAGYL